MAVGQGSGASSSGRLPPPPQPPWPSSAQCQPGHSSATAPPRMGQPWQPQLTPVSRVPWGASGASWHPSATWHHPSTRPPPPVPLQCPAPPVVPKAAPPPGTVWPSPPSGTLPHTRACPGSNPSPWPHPTPTWHSQQPQFHRFFFKTPPSTKTQSWGEGRGWLRGPRGTGTTGPHHKILVKIDHF